MIPAPEQRSLADWLRWQETLNPREIELGLLRVRAVAQRLGLLQRYATTLTVGGTNGKGSSATLAALIWREAGYRTGLYTSPHVRHYEERVQIDGCNVEASSLCRAFVAIERARDDTPLTYFEFGTLAALWLFREAGVEVQVLEVGLGGRLDAVNVIDTDAALLTNVGLDHQDWLGHDREQIGLEKAGIFRAGKPAVIVERAPPRSVLAHAAQVGAPVQILGRDYDFVPASQNQKPGWQISLPHRVLADLPAPGQAGAVQFQNAAGVIAVIEAMRDRQPVADQAIRRALPQLRVRARLERRGRYLLDVAHNAEAAAVLVAHLRALSWPRVILVLGMLSDKPIEAVAEQFTSVVQGGYAVGLPGARGLDARTLAQRAATAGLVLQPCDNMATALIQARAQAGDEGLIVITGSFLTIAEAEPLL